MNPVSVYRVYLMDIHDRLGIPYPDANAADAVSALQARVSRAALDRLLLDDAVSLLARLARYAELVDAGQTVAIPLDTNLLIDAARVVNAYRDAAD